jgi:hypothetical protein
MNHEHGEIHKWIWIKSFGVNEVVSGVFKWVVYILHMTSPWPHYV